MRENAKASLKKHNAEVIAIFREEKTGKKGLEKIKSQTKVDFTLALDLDKKLTPKYSPKRGTFDNYVIGPDGKIVKIIDGSLRVRGKADQIAKILDAIAKQ